MDGAVPVAGELPDRRPAREASREDDCLRACRAHAWRLKAARWRSMSAHNTAAHRESAPAIPRPRERRPPPGRYAKLVPPPRDSSGALLAAHRHRGGPGLDGPRQPHTQWYLPEVGPVGGVRTAGAGVEPDLPSTRSPSSRSSRASRPGSSGYGFREDVTDPPQRYPTATTRIRRASTRGNGIYIVERLKFLAAFLAARTRVAAGA